MGGDRFIVLMQSRNLESLLGRAITKFDSATLSEAKQQAKRIPGSALFVERRQYQARGALQYAAVSPAPTFVTPLTCQEA